MTGEKRKTYSLAQLVERFGGTVIGDAGIRIRQVAPIESAVDGEITFLSNRKYQKLLSGSRAGAVIVGPDAAEATAIARIVSDNPYAYYARVAALLNPEEAASPGIHDRAVVHPGATVSRTATIAACAVIEDGAAIVYHGCTIGRRGILHSGAVIGADGFGMAPDAGKWLKIPQIGRVVIGDDVEVGASTTIDRGALADTVIEDGVKMDNQIQIGHNCRVGAHTVIAGCTGIAGSTRIGSHCLIGGSAMIGGHLEIVDNVTVSGGTTVAKSITQPGTYTSVFPYSPHEDWVKNASLLRHLREMMDRIRSLERKIEKTEGQ
jgi:UDP-3-O-[3-hydroxymyristoyl] glucosamine N-acyltransferase